MNKQHSEVTVLAKRIDALQPLAPSDWTLLPLTPACERRDGDYLRSGVCVA